MKSWWRQFWFGWAALWMALSSAQAELIIEITEGVEGAVPIAVVPFGSQVSALPKDVAQVIASDLKRSGRFDPVAERDMISRPHRGSEVNFQDWRLLGAENLVIGRVERRGGGHSVQFQLFDVFRGAQLTGYSFRTGEGALRRTGHQIADIVYETLTGEPGAFDTRIAYITAEGKEDARRYALKIADSDGHNPRTVLRSRKPIMSPSWSPSGNRLAYVSFENDQPEIYIQDLNRGERRRLTNYAGLNGAPAWSPDGQRLVLVLSKDGNPEIYVLDLANEALTRLTRSAAIDTEPVWSPDGKHIAFTSNRGGSPQIYRIPANGGRAQRLTFEGNYNARASYGPDGKKLAMVHRERGNYRIAVQDLDTGALQVVSEGSLDESPSFAPNGSMIIYAAAEGDQGVLRAVSVDGRVRQRLSEQQGDTREPTWSPYRQ